jgi:diketogulonate reductase-like aldo/keto reductase
LRRIAARLSELSGERVDEATVILKWTMGKGVVVVTTSGNSVNIVKMAASQGLPELTQKEIVEIDQAGMTVHFRYYVGGW